MHARDVMIKFTSPNQMSITVRLVSLHQLLCLRLFGRHDTNCGWHHAGQTTLERMRPAPLKLFFASGLSTPCASCSARIQFALSFGALCLRKYQMSSTVSGIPSTEHKTQKNACEYCATLVSLTPVALTTLRRRNDHISSNRTSKVISRNRRGKTAPSDH